MKSRRNGWLIAGGIFSLIAALLHVAIIVSGVFGNAEWYRTFGAPADMVAGVEQGRWAPHLATLGVAALLTLAAAYAFSGARRIGRMPLIRLALTVVSAAYMARGLLLLPIAVTVPYEDAKFDYWSSLIVLMVGICYVIGTTQSWRYLSRKEPI